MIWVTKAQYLEEYRVKIAFNDGFEGTVDLRDVIFNDERAIFNQLKDQDLFRRFKLDMDTIVWDNGLDLAPEYLHSMVTAAADNSKTAAL